MVFVLYLKTKQLWIHNFKVLVLHHVLFAALIVAWLAGFFILFIAYVLQEVSIYEAQLDFEDFLI